ncbi:hypothetical protein RB195_007733 [Necator americanus]|uniref:Uncharacterized protein n=1 Tax=Necator americanus TaxID=51031 RepID=A0ABR1C1B2_NECAM
MTDTKIPQLQNRNSLAEIRSAQLVMQHKLAEKRSPDFNHDVNYARTPLRYSFYEWRGGIGATAAARDIDSKLGEGTTTIRTVKR